MTNTGTSNITQAILKVMAGVSFVQKAGKNEFHGYKYATEGDALAVLRPHLIENELVVISDVIEHTSPDEFGNTTVKVQYRILHSSGEEIVCHFVGCGNDRSSKGAIGGEGKLDGVVRDHRPCHQPGQGAGDREGWIEPL